VNDPTTACGGAAALCALLGAWVKGDRPEPGAAHLDPGAFAAAVERNRLEALVWSQLPDGAAPPGGRTGAWELSYLQGLGRGMKLLDAGAAACAALEKGGIPALGMRGPFAGARLYGDVALRYGADVDLMVPRSLARRAAMVLEGLGYRFHHPVLTRSACARWHLEWPFRHERSGVCLDLHWAVDHPFKPWNVDYAAVFARAVRAETEHGAWLEPCPAHQLVLSCLHAEKEVRLHGSLPCPDRLFQLAGQGRLRHWLDIALALRILPVEEREDAAAMAVEWAAGPAVAAHWAAASTLLGVSGPPDGLAGFSTVQHRGFREDLAGRIENWAGGARMTSAFSFRLECLSDAVRYAGPARGGWLLMPRLAAGGLEMAWLAARAAGRRRFAP